MTATERNIESTRKACIDFVNSQFELLLERVRANGEFLDEMNATNAAGEYVTTMIVEAPPATPDLSEIGTLEQEIEKASQYTKDTAKTAFQQDLEWELVPVDDERYAKYVSWLISKNVDEQALHNAQKKHGIRFDPKAYDHLRNLIWYRSELMKGKAGVFTLKDIFSQADTTEVERVLWKELEKTTIKF